jgi:hypothetical protein
MNTIIIIAGVLIIALIALTFFATKPSEIIPPITTSTTATSQTTAPTLSAEEELILSNQINTLTEEQLAAISTDMSGFSTAVENSISDESSIFMYQ